MINEAYLKEDPKKNLVLRIVLPFPCNFVHNHSESLSVSTFPNVVIRNARHVMSYILVLLSLLLLQRNLIIPEVLMTSTVKHQM